MERELFTWHVRLGNVERGRSPDARWGGELDSLLKHKRKSTVPSTELSGDKTFADLPLSPLQAAAPSTIRPSLLRTLDSRSMISISHLHFQRFSLHSLSSHSDCHLSICFPDASGLYGNNPGLTLAPSGSLHSGRPLKCLKPPASIQRHLFHSVKVRMH